MHDLDLVCHVAGEAPSELFAFGSNFLPEIEALGDLDNVLVSMRFPSGLLASIDVSRKGAHGYDQRIEVLGSEGMVHADNRPQTTAVVATREGSALPPIDHSFPTRYFEAYRAEFACFLACVGGEQEVPIRHADVRLSHQLADAAERSVREGRPIRLTSDSGS